MCVPQKPYPQPVMTFPQGDLLSVFLFHSLRFLQAFFYSEDQDTDPPSQSNCSFCV